MRHVVPDALQAGEAGREVEQRAGIMAQAPTSRHWRRRRRRRRMRDYVSVENGESDFDRAAIGLYLRQTETKLRRLVCSPAQRADGFAD